MVCNPTYRESAANKFKFLAALSNFHNVSNQTWEVRVLKILEFWSRSLQTFKIYFLKLVSRTIVSTRNHRVRLHRSPGVEFDIRKREMLAWNYLQTKHSPVTLRPSSRQVQQARWPQGVAVATWKIYLQKLTNRNNNPHPTCAYSIQTQGAAVSIYAPTLIPWGIV